MFSERVDYNCGGISLKGYLAYNNQLQTKRPAVIVAHAWRGQDSFARQKADDLANMGYLAFAADMYGDGISVQTNEEAFKLMLPLFLDRALLRRRINAALDTLKQHPLVKPDSIGAIGFCFGGLTVLELLRSGADIAGAVSFHGILGNTLGSHKAVTQPIAKKVKGAILILTGHNDPSVTPEDIRKTQEELTQAGVDWEMDIYGHAMHAFTNPEANDPKNGLAFNEKANQRSWQAMRRFFNETLS